MPDVYTTHAGLPGVRASRGGGHQRVDGLAIDLLSALRVLERGVHQRVALLRGRGVGRRLRQLADDALVPRRDETAPPSLDRGRAR